MARETQDAQKKAVLTRRGARSHVAALVWCITSVHPSRRQSYHFLMTASLAAIFHDHGGAALELTVSLTSAQYWRNYFREAGLIN